MAAERPGITVVGTIDPRPDLRGEDVGRLKGLPRPLGVRIAGDWAGVPAADVAVVCTTPRLGDLLPLIAATWTLFPLKRETLEKYGDRWTEPDNIVTNGPFMMQSWKHDQEMVLVPNPHYWGARPALQRVVLKLVSDPATQGLVPYENGELDF